MRAAVLAVVVFPLLAGCLGAESDTQADEERVVDGVWFFDGTGPSMTTDPTGIEIPAFVLNQVNDRISGEPTLGITRTGAIFTTAVDYDALPDNPSQNLPRTWYMRSTDGGLTWEDKTPTLAGQSTHPSTFDNYVYVDPTTGRVFALDMTPTFLCNHVSWSDDDGESWVSRPGACIPGVNDHPTLFAGPATSLTNTALYPNQLYLCVNQLVDVLCYQSPDGGLTWLAPPPAALSVDVGRLYHCGTGTGHGRVSFVDGTIVVGKPWCGEAAVLVSLDGGITFVRSFISRDGEFRVAGSDVEVAVDLAGNIYAVWAGEAVWTGDYYGWEAEAVFFSMSRDGGASWSEPTEITAPVVTAVKFPTLVAGSEGRVAFLYVGTETPSGAKIESCREEIDTPVCTVHDQDEYENATWNAYIGFVHEAHTDMPQFVTVRANSVQQPLKRGSCIDRCRGDEGAMMDFLDIEIDPMTGQVFAALVDVCSGECDGAGKKTSEVYQKSVGLVAVQTAGPRLLTEPIAERTFLVSR